jgi:RNA 2',3'-cyclic 3'-phosphodiesterase
MERRIFIGIRASFALRQKIEEWQGAHTRFPVRWVPTRNLHITLIPPWYEAEEDIPRIVATLQSIPVPMQPMSISFTHVDYGPRLSHPSLIWLTGQAPAEITQLNQLLGEKFAPNPSNKKWLPHITIARFRPNGFPSFPEDAIDEYVEWDAKPEALTLFESRLSSEGSEYNTIVEFPF